MKSMGDVINNKYKNFNFKLEREFDNALSDKDFLSLVTKLKLPKEVLMKYTSRLQNTVSELNNCKNCPNLFECKNEVCGFVNYPTFINNGLVFEYVSCKYKKDMDKRESYKKNISLYDMPKAIREASMKDIHTDDKTRFEAIKKLKQFIDDYLEKKEVVGLYLTGSFGCGKTYLVSAMLNELAKKDKRVVIVYFPEFLRSLKSAFGDDEEYKNTFNAVKKAEVLLLDDLGAEAVTPWGRDEILGTILQYRMDEGLPTFFTSNLTIAELEEHLSMSSQKIDKLKARRIVERIKQLSEEIIMVSINKR